MKDATYRAIGHDDWRTLMEVTTDQGTDHAYVNDDVPGVIRWWADDQCLPGELCERMGWPSLGDQRKAAREQADAFNELMEIYDNA